LIALEFVDKLFDACPQLQFWIFNKRVLLPLTQLPEAVAKETGQTISEGELRIRAGQGWFPLLPGAGDDGTEEGSPLYVPSRIGLFLKLQKEGYSTDELRVVAEYEEGLIDNVLVTHELTYADDDLEVLLLHNQERVDSLEQCFDSDGTRTDRTPEIEKARRDLDIIIRLRAEGVPDRLSKTIARQAFRVRAFNEWLRLELLDHGAWRSACKRAGVADRTVHDFRRTAVDRLEWSGVPRVVAMKLTGHETDAIYSRYHIARGKDLRAGVARVADYIEALNGSVQESGKEAATAIRAQQVGSRK